MSYDPRAPLSELLQKLNEAKDTALVKEISTLIENRFQNLENTLKTSERSRANLEEKIDSLTPQKVGDVLSAYDLERLELDVAKQLIQELKKLCPSVSPIEQKIIDCEPSQFINKEEAIAFLKELQKKK